ncbi:hypothetical protein GC209_13410 [bacterium]|nr:hypothetical protein [bacterium]
MQTQSEIQSWIDTTNLVLGAVLFLAPWAVGPLDAGAQWNAWIGGGLIALFAAVALARFAAWQEWGNLTLGLWALMSPWIFGFDTDPGAMSMHVIIGLGVVWLAGFQLWRISQPPRRATSYERARLRPDLFD